MYFKGNPRKFSDKIALIKQKEALSNASFQSAINGITEIRMNGQPDGDTPNVDVKDNYSNNSYSPDSFTSESTAVSLKNNFPRTNEPAEVDMINLTVNNDNEVFRSCHELSQASDIYQRQSGRDDLKFRHGSDRSHLKTKDTNFSHMDGFYPQNKHLKRLCEPMSSGSLPNVSVWNSKTEFLPKTAIGMMSDKESGRRDCTPESQTSFDNGKFMFDTRSVLVEHLKGRYVQNQSYSHPHTAPVTNDQGSLDLAARISDSSIYRTRKHGFDHGDTNSAGNLMVSNQLNYYTNTSNPHLSVPSKYNIDNMNVNNDQRHSEGIPFSSVKYRKLNINCSTDNGSNQYDFVNKSLTPTGNQSNTWFTSNNGFLQPPAFSNVLGNENWRRVASDSSILNSLKCQNDQVSQTNHGNDSSFQRVNSLKREHVNCAYQRNQSMITYPHYNNQRQYDVSSQVPPFKPERSTMSISPSLHGNMVTVNPHNTNGDQSNGFSVNKLRTLNDNPQQMYVFNELNSFPGDISRQEMELPLSEKFDSAYIPMETDDSRMNSYPKDNKIKNVSEQRDFQTPIDSSTDSNPENHECYWGQSDDTDATYNNEPSPKTKPCENLDPQKVLVDIKADFAGIPEIILNDADPQRRDSLNWTVEVLKSLNSESGNLDTFTARDRSLSGYQPMISLTEEEKLSTDVIEC